MAWLDFHHLPGLKNAPSQFQKVTLFQPLLANVLIYVDDILLFSKDEESHAKLLTEFYNLVKSQGIMLSEKKMVIWQSSIDFLGVNISNGKYTLQPHIASSLGECVSLFLPWNYKLSRKCKGNEIFCFTSWNIILVKLRSLDIFFNSGRLRRA